MSFTDINPQCLSFDNSGACLNCSSGYYIGISSTCSPVNPLCDAYDMSNGLCITCVQGYAIQNNTCLSFTDINPQCLQFDSNGVCLNCSSGYYIGTNSICTLVSLLCNGYDMSNGLCITCVQGYAIQNDTCLSFTDINPQCLSFDNSGVCLNCSSGYYIGTICSPVNPLCNTYDMSNGQCITCVQGYAIQNNTCLSFTDINPQCLSFDNSGVCLNCSSGYYIGISSICSPVNPLCNAYDMSNGQCITCVQGYAIQNNTCLSFTDINPQCLQFDNNGVCLNCSSDYYIGPNSICISVSPLCNAYDMSNGLCITCIQGYAI